MNSYEHLLIAQNCTRHDFENLTKSIRSGSGLNGLYRPHIDLTSIQHRPLVDLAFYSTYQAC
jgi:hypothetical protein